VPAATICSGNATGLAGGEDLPGKEEKRYGHNGIGHEELQPFQPVATFGFRADILFCLELAGAR
jgi:hypothetical protein